MMREYPKHIKRMIREHLGLAINAEFGVELAKLEQQFVAWRKGAITAGDLNEMIHEYHQGPAREIWSRYNYSRMEDLMIAHVIVSGLLPREAIPAELLEALQPVMASIEESRAMENTSEQQEADA